jgi:hypothetical protein
VDLPQHLNLKNLIPHPPTTERAPTGHWSWREAEWCRQTAARSASRRR